MMIVRILAFIAGLAIIQPALAADAVLKDFLGVFVGVAEVFDGAGHKLSERDVDMIITSSGSRGFEIAMTSVQLVEGRRDVPGVRHRRYSALFQPSDNGKFYLAKSPYDPFEESKSTELFAGKPLEWAQITGSSLVVYTYAVLEDGRYELQVFERALDGDSMRTLYERHLDGELQRRTAGTMVRSD